MELNGRHPPSGRFLEIDGARLHYRDGGAGDAIVLLHGNGGTIESFDVSGIWDLAVAAGRAIAFDRPGSGHSDRPRDRRWTPAAQAALLLSALRRLDARRPVIVGHSWGSLVALEMGLAAPETIAGLVLIGGYYFPTRRLDVAMTSIAALPGIGGPLRRTVLPIAIRIGLQRFLRRLFAPEPVPHNFADFPLDLVLRPSQLHAMAEDTAFMNPATAALQGRYARLRMPVTIIAGTGDRIVDTTAHSARLARTIPHAELRLLPGGHMIHHQIPADIVDAAGRLRTPRADPSGPIRAGSESDALTL